MAITRRAASTWMLAMLLIDTTITAATNVSYDF
jgi:hypothetical protein